MGSSSCAAKPPIWSRLVTVVGQRPSGRLDEVPARSQPGQYTTRLNASHLVSLSGHEHVRPTRKQQRAGHTARRRSGGAAPCSAVGPWPRAAPAVSRSWAGLQRHERVVLGGTGRRMMVRRERGADRDRRDRRTRDPGREELSHRGLVTAAPEERCPIGPSSRRVWGRHLGVASAGLDARQRCRIGCRSTNVQEDNSHGQAVLRIQGQDVEQVLGN